ncbi:cyclic AMP response element-binding protein B isoform X24 [Athalia rosae]|uniref:cyclic AMP response element-binding protein B isoform X24 n=1 Tax=Athalia rosae TaxID=37344 RepID=UPI0020332515|nr:cyclic AMP response element-binding protein B isoform X24 [Athalia rosae]
MQKRDSGPQAMESMVEENGSTVDPLSQGSQGGDAAPAIATSVQSFSRSQHHLVASTSIVQLTLPLSGTTQVQSVIQPNQQSVIQTATNIQPVALSKANVILVSKPNSVIQTTQGSLQTLQVVETGSDDSFSDEESPKKRRDILTRRPSYRKILNDLGGGEIAAYTGHGVVVEDAARKRELRLLKNREAARECRRKKKEYIKCLENRVAVLENRNQTLIDELKSLKELYQQKTD